MKHLVVIHPEDTVEIYRSTNVEKGKIYVIDKQAPMPEDMSETLYKEIGYKLMMDFLHGLSNTGGW